MPIVVSPSESIGYLQRFLSHNKARGMVAELALKHEINLYGSPMQNKLVSGGWLISPKVEKPQHYRYWVFVLPQLYANIREIQNEIEHLQHDRGWQGLATFISQSGIGIIVSGAYASSAKMALDNLTWVSYGYVNETLIQTDGDNPFVAWPGGRGRAANGSPWSEDILQRMGTAHGDELIELAMRQAFYYGYLKKTLKKPTEDPYDVDAFVVGYSGTVMPVEIKEKSPTPNGEFGIDAGRILMLLRLCLATDSNSLYLIREVDSSSTRQLVNWRYITLSDMIIGCRWNLQAGGLGMGGGATQTVMISGSLFQNFSLANLSEDWLLQNRSLQGTVHAAASQLAQSLTTYLHL